jgi:hypothetical protein
MTQIVPFDFKSTLPVAGGSFFADAVDEFSGGVATGFPSLSIKGREFAITRNGETKTIQRKNEDGDLEAVRSINLVILKGNPNLSKVFYKGKYEEGSDTKPTCFSNDGKAPDPEAVEPQCATCAMCPQNEWGSRITDAGKKARACSDSRRLAVAAADAVDDPMLLRVPATSVKTLAEYAKQLKVRGKSLPEVLTRLSFTPGVAFPSLEFEPKGLLGEELLVSISQVRNSDTVNQIIGLASTPRAALVEAPKPGPLPIVEKPEPIAEAPAKPIDAAQDRPIDAAQDRPKLEAKVEAPVLTAVVEEDDEDAELAAAQAALAEAKAKAKAAKAAKAEAPAPKPKAEKPKLEAKVEEDADDAALRESLTAALGDDFDDLDL